MKRKTYSMAIVLVVILSFAFFLSVPAGASSITISWGDQAFTYESSPGGVVIDYGSFTPSENTAPASHSPIPSTLLLLASGLAGAAVFRKKFRR